MPPPNTTITLPRRLLREFRLVAKKHLGIKSRDDGPPVRVHAADEGGTRLTTTGVDGRGVSLHIPSDRPPVDLILPLSLLADAGAAKNGDVQLAEADAGRAVVANWDERGVPRSARGMLEKRDRDRADKFQPPSIDRYHDPGGGFGDILRAACEVTDADSGRYALGCVRLDPVQQRIEATDSHHLLIARGFTFPFDEPVLLPAPHAISAAPPRQVEVSVGFIGGGAQRGTVALQSGDWTIWSPEVKDARFPELDRVVPAEGKAAATLTDRDVRFLLDRIGDLPGRGEERQPVTLDLTGAELLVRAKEEGGTAVELAASPAETRGTGTCVADRRFLLRALSLGCTRLAMNGHEEPVKCETPDGNATVVFATLAGDPVPADGVVRVRNDADANEETAAPAATIRRRDVAHNHTTTNGRITTQMSRNRINGSTNGHAANGHTPRNHFNGDEDRDAVPEVEALLERVSSLGTTLSDAAGEARSLATDLRKLRKRDRAMDSALAGLRKLGSLVG